MENESLRQYQQGDVIFYPLGYDNCVDPIATEIPKGAKPRKGNLLLRGNSGNHHTLSGKGGRIYDADGGKVFLRILKATPMMHEEHKNQREKIRNITLPKGDYEVRFVQEIDPLSGLKRQVVD